MNSQPEASGALSESKAPRAKHVVVTVHGIRTFGQWQERLERLLRAETDEFEVLHYKFGRFSVIAFLIPFLRWLATRQFRKELLEIAAQYPDSRIDLVGHSFGTHLIGWGLYGIPKSKQPRIHTIILAGSVLRPGFPWRELLSRGTVGRVINECGTKDFVLVLNQLIVPFTGVAGILGFKGMSSDRFRNNWYRLGHSGYFRDRGRDTDEFMRNRWIPLLTSDHVPLHTDERPQGEFYSLWVFCLQNMELVKAGMYLTCVLLFWVWYRGVIETRQAAIARQLAEQSEILREQQPDKLFHSVLLAIDSLRHASTFEGDLALRRDLTLLPVFAKKIGITDNVTVSALSFSSDDSLLAIAGSDKSVQVWRTDSSGMVSELHHPSEVKAAIFAYNTDDLLTVTEDGTVWSWNHGAEHRDQSIEKDSDTAVVYEGLDGPTVAAANPDFTVSVWISQTRRKLTLRHDNRVMSLAFDGDAHQLASGSYDYSARVWSISSDDAKAKRINHSHPVSAVALSADGRLLAFGDTFGLIRIWDLSSDREVPTGMSHLGWITSLAFSPDSKWLASGSRDNTARVWDSETGHEVTRIASDGPVSSVMFSHSGQWLATGSVDHTARIWDLGQTLPVSTEGQLCAIAFDSGGQNVAFGDTYGNIEVHTLNPQLRVKKLRETKGQESAVLMITYVPRDRSLIAGFDDGILRSWTTGEVTGQERVIQTGASIDSLSFSRDGQLAAFGNWDGEVMVIRTSDGKQLSSIVHPGGVLAVAFAPDEKHLATGGADDKTARLWELPSGKCTGQLKHDDAVSAEAFSPDGRYLATGSGKIARVWDVKAGKPIAELPCDSPVELVAFSPDGHLLITTGTYRTARVWNWSSAIRDAEVELEGTACAAAFAPDGTVMALGSSDGTARLWSLTVERMIDDACQRLENYSTGDGEQVSSRLAYTRSCTKTPR